MVSQVLDRLSGLGLEMAQRRFRCPNAMRQCFPGRFERVGSLEDRAGALSNHGGEVRSGMINHLLYLRTMLLRMSLRRGVDSSGGLL